jgi:hypothetical protein
MPAADTSGGAAPPADGTTATNGVNTAMQVLFGYIPTEVLTLYVAVVAAIHPNSSASGPAAAGATAVQSAISTAVQQPSAVTPVDWGVFWTFLVATPVVFWVVYATKLKGAQKPIPLAFAAWSLWEMTAATVAYAVWAFALPASPFREFGSWYSSGLAGVVVLVTSTVLGLLAPLFQNKLGT